MLATGNSQLAFLAELVHVHRRRLVARHRVPHGRVRRPAAHALGELPALHARAGRGDAAVQGVPLPHGRHRRRARPKPTATPRCCARIRSTCAAAGSARTATSRSTIRRSPTSTTRVDVKIVALEPASRRQQVGRGPLRDDRRRADARDHRHDPRAAPRPPRARDRARGAQGRAGARRAAGPDHDRVPGVVPPPPAARDAVPRRGVGVAPRLVTRRRAARRRAVRAGAAVPEPARAACAASRRSSPGCSCIGFSIAISVRAAARRRAVGRVPPGRRARRPDISFGVVVVLVGLVVLLAWIPLRQHLGHRHGPQHAVGRLHREPRPAR